MDTTQGPIRSFKCFDQLGFLAPFVIRGRMILKGIWQTEGKQWDSYIDENLNNQFADWVAGPNAGEIFEVSRCYLTINENVTNELHVFGDASEDAFYAVAYLVTETEKAEREDSFIMGKTRIAPVKHRKSPKLELMAAVTGNRERMLSSSFSQNVYVVRFQNSNSVDQVKQR